jgi:hypothetical protein
VGLKGFGKSHDELLENPSKTSMSRRQDFKKFPVIFPVLREFTKLQQAGRDGVPAT